jgi:serine/threonine-protein kinase RsbW
MQNQLEAVDPMVLRLKVAGESNVTPEMQIRLEICLSEALTNLALHAQTPHNEATIEVVMSGGEGVLRVEIFDPEGAEPFDMREHARVLSDIDAMSESGRGLGLILACADGVDYVSVKGRMCLALTFLPRD